MQKCENYANTKVALLVDIRKLSKDLMQTKVDNRAYSKQLGCRTTRLKDELQMAKVDYFLTMVWDELILLYKELKSSEAKLSTVEPVATERRLKRGQTFLYQII